MMNSPIIRNKHPYQSSNIYRVTASLFEDFPNLTPFEKLDRARKVVFTVDYPTPNNIDREEYKEFFEKMFISHYWECYFKNETFESFQIQLYSKMLEVLPTYNYILESFFNKNRDELILTNYYEKINGTSDITGNRKSDENTTDKNTSEQKNINSAFPASLNRAGNNIGSVNYSDTGSLVNGSSNDTGTRKTEDNSTENRKDFTEREGYTGNRLEGITKFNEMFNGIFTKLLGEFAPLFTSILF